MKNKDVVDHCEEWPLTPKQICYLRNKCLYLRTAYTIALEKMGNDGITWVNTCCQEVVDLLGCLGFITTIDRKRISYWNIESMKKILKSHRAALDFDRAFVVTSIKTCDVEIDWQKELGGGEEMTNKKRKITK